MSLDTTTLLAILAMAVVTYVTRIAGLFVADRLVLTGRAKAAFDAIPPAVLVAVIAPTALTTGWAEADRRRHHGRRRVPAAAACDRCGGRGVGGGAAKSDLRLNKRGETHRHSGASDSESPDPIATNVVEDGGNGCARFCIVMFMGSGLRCAAPE